MVAVSSQQLLRELTEHNDFFDMLVDMIPSKLYIAGNTGDDFNPKSKYMQYSNSTSKEARRAKAKAGKRRKLDPAQAETTVEVKARLEKSNKSKTQLPQKVLATPTPTESPAAPAETDTATATPATPNQSRIEALREKLQAKILAKQGGRPSNPDQVSKRAARRTEKLRRKEEAVKRQKSAASKVPASTATNYKISTDTASPSHDLAALDFGRLAGLNSNSKDNYQKANKSLANLSKSKNLEKMLADAETKRQKLEELKKGSEEDQLKAKGMLWNDTFKEADGRRVKDDPAKLKKALKRKASKKTKSQKAWKTRLDQTAATQNEKQKIRQHNLTARKEGGKAGASLSKKRIVDKEDDKGRRLSRAGFEGRKQEFLNGGKSSSGKSSGGKSSGGKSSGKE